MELKGGQERLSRHLEAAHSQGRLPDNAVIGAAGGGPCGDYLLLGLALDRAGRLVAAGFQAEGCAALRAAGSALLALIEGRSLLEAACLDAAAVERELGGLTPGKLHVAVLAEEALHRALGRAAWGVALAAKPKRVLVALSGGVDSAVAALLLQEAGWETIGVTFELWRDREGDPLRSCCSAAAVKSARAVAQRLRIPHLTVDLRTVFKEKVVARWLRGQLAGLTPYPCAPCNAEVRFWALAELRLRLGGAAFASGHYARLVRRGGELYLARAKDRVKDQAYALAALPPHLLAHLLLPLGDLSKGEVRARAGERGLAVAQRPDSQDLCFLAGTTRARFLARHGGQAPQTGPVVDRSGRYLGTHHGFSLYTVGQRKGLDLGGRGPYFVLRSEPAANRLVVGPREALLTSEVDLERLVLRLPPDRIDGLKVRSRGAHLAGRLALAGPRQARFLLTTPRERTAPGQLACLFAGELVAGYGLIGERSASRRRAA